MENSKDVTIYDIANLLNVAPSTVSRALKDHPSIGKKTIRAVKKMAAEKGYMTNVMAAGLRTKRTNTIGVVVPSIDDPFYTGLISGIELELNETGYNFLLLQSNGSFSKESANIQKLFQNRICGLIIAPCSQQGKYAYLSTLNDSGIPIVALYDPLPELKHCSILLDNYAIGHAATSHLISRGCNTIAFVGGHPEVDSFTERERGYRAALAEANLVCKDDLVIYTEKMTIYEGRKSAGCLLNKEKRPDGVVSVTDTLAAGIIQYAKETHIKIPADIAVVGFNNEPLSRIIEPSLTTFAVPGVEMGQAAVHKIVTHDDRIHHGPSSERLLFNVSLIQRGSSQKANCSLPVPSQ